jgi:hypothetical protein
MPTEICFIGTPPVTTGNEPITFHLCLDFDGKWVNAVLPSKGYKKITLICKNYIIQEEVELDLMFAQYNGTCRRGVLYLGCFNSGVV